MPSADALWLGDARWKLARPICDSPALEVLSTPAHPQVTQTVGRFKNQSGG